MSPSEANTDYDIRISIEADPFPIDPDPLQDLVRNVLRRFEIPKASVDIAIVDDLAMSEIHNHYFGNPEITDVVSFDLGDEHQAARCFQTIVNARQAARQAQQRDHAPLAELALYIVHGLLHNLGYNDATAEQAGQMHEMEDRILQENRFGKVYDRRPKT